VKAKGRFFFLRFDVSIMLDVESKPALERTVHGESLCLGAVLPADAPASSLRRIAGGLEG
jgi:hypothetical protein